MINVVFAGHIVSANVLMAGFTSFTDVLVSFESDESSRYNSPEA